MIQTSQSTIQDLLHWVISSCLSETLVTPLDTYRGEDHLIFVGVSVHSFTPPGVFLSAPLLTCLFIGKTQFYKTVMHLENVLGWTFQKTKLSLWQDMYLAQKHSIQYNKEKVSCSFCIHCVLKPQQPQPSSWSMFSLPLLTSSSETQTDLCDWPSDSQQSPHCFQVCPIQVHYCALWFDEKTHASSVTWRPSFHYQPGCSLTTASFA